MNFQLKITKINMTILGLSLVMVLLISGVELIDYRSVAEIMDNCSWWAGTASVILYVFFGALAATNLFAVGNRYDIAKVSSVITFAMIILTMLYVIVIANCASIGEINLAGWVYIVFSGIIAFLCNREIKNG